MPMPSTCPVTVVLPCYNAADTVAMAIKSAAFQTLPPAEILIFDDGSSDHSPLVIQSTIAAIEGRSPSRIRYFASAENKGVYTIRNRALDEASQTLIAFLDADDYWHPQKLEIQHRFFEEDPDLALVCHRVVHREGSPRTLPFFAHNFVPVSDVLKHRTVLLRNIMVTISVMIRKPENGLRFDESKRRGSDMLFWLEIVLGGGKAVMIEENMSFTQKPLCGAGGLSGNIWKAEMAQQHNLYMLWQRGYIGLPTCLFLRGFSLLKMVRRYGLREWRNYQPSTGMVPAFRRERLSAAQ